MWLVTCNTWHVTNDMWHVTCDILHMEEGEHSPKLLGLGLGVKLYWRFWGKWYVTEWLNELISDKGVCRAAPATPGLNSYPLKIGWFPPRAWKQVRRRDMEWKKWPLVLVKWTRGILVLHDFIGGSRWDLIGGGKIVKELNGLYWRLKRGQRCNKCSSQLCKGIWF